VRLFISLAVCLAPAALVRADATPTPTPDPTYAALRGMKPDKTGVPVQDLVLTRDVIRLHFDSGTFYLLAPVEGRTLGAVFIGKGGWELTPATEGERRHLALLTEEKDFKSLVDTFERATLLFTDGTADEIRKATAGPAPAAAEAEKAGHVFDGYLAMQKKGLRSNLHLRLLADVLAGTPPDQGMFLASVDGKKLPAGLLAVDPKGIETLGLSPMLGGETTTFFTPGGFNPGFWYLSHAKTGRPPAPYLAVDGLHYAIDTRIEKNTDLAGTTVMDLEVKVPGLRVLPLALVRKLRVSSAAVAYADGPFRDVAFIQEDEKDDADTAVVLPEAPGVGSRIHVRLAYKGDEVLESHGDGNYRVRARESWYSNVGSFNDVATFDLTYHVPKRNQVVSVGQLVDSHVDEDAAVFHFRADDPVRVAGFNYGRFRKLARTDSGMVVQVFTNPGMPEFSEDIEEFFEHTKFDTGHLADSALADGVNAIRTCTHYFGPLPIKEVNITQQVDWFFGQSWPSLIYLPYVAFLDSTTRVQLGLMDVKEFVDEVGPHEMAHQWWGHQIGWDGYRDQWLSEGLAEFSAALVSQQTGGMKKYVSYFTRARAQILKKWPGNSYANWEVGPINLGWRLPEGDRQRGAYSAVVYTKGSYVPHMLRMMMRESGRPKTPGGKPADPDENFIAMMKDFTTSFAGKNPSNADFQKVVERHMTKPMNLTGDGKMDWFFREWLDGTEIPRYKYRLDGQPAGEGKFRLTGEITQSEVGPDFRMLVGIYGEFDEGRTALLARVPLVGASTLPLNVEMALPQRPKAIVLNALRDVLDRD
jgi:hypothetical protein